MDRTLLVYYNNSAGVNITYPKMPADWEWIGSGTMIRGKSKLNQDVQFAGSMKNKDKVKQSLKKTFDKYGIPYKIVDIPLDNSD